MASIHVGDIGAVFEVTVRDQDDAVINIAAATVLGMTLRKPNGTLLEKTAVLSTNGTDGKLRYTAIAGDLNLAGRWQLSASVTIGASTKFTTDPYDFSIVDNLS